MVVARTFSKCFGMAGIRMGYAIGHKDTIAKMADWDGVGNVSVMALLGAARRSPCPLRGSKDEQKRKRGARSFTQKWFADRGYTPTDSQTNFMFVDIKRPAQEFREACVKEGVLVGRDFPPYEKTHVPDLGRHDGRDAEGGASVRTGAGTAGQGGGRRSRPKTSPATAGSPRAPAIDAGLLS